MNDDNRSTSVQAALELKPKGLGPDRMEEIFSQYYGLVFRAAYRVTGNAADAEDVLQTVFLRVVRRADSVRDVAEIESYLYRAAVNAALDLLRSRQRGRAVPFEETSPSVGSDPTLSPDRMLASDEIRRWLREAVAGLSDMAGEAFVLRFFEGRKNTEIADILGTTPSTVAVTLHRARERLEREYRAYVGGVS
jgi:RNA polymerase sigma-70 factor (ECF subfamily)